VSGFAFLAAGSGTLASPTAGESTDAEIPTLSDFMKRSRSVFEAETRPMHSNFEDVGMVGVIKRLLVLLRARAQEQSLDIPKWVWSLDFLQASSQCAHAGAGTVHLIAAMTRVACETRKEDYAPIEDAILGSGSTSMQIAAMTRMCFGDMLEALAASAVSDMVSPNCVAESAVCKKKIAMLYYDSYCISIWTSAHAEFLATINELLSGREATETLVRDIMVPPPDLYTVLNLSNLTHIVAMNDRLYSPRCCSKSSQSIISIMNRVTNAGSRGWETTLLAAMKDSEGAVRMCMQCMAVALSGMNPVIHPSVRRRWKERFVCIRTLRNQTHQDFREAVTGVPYAVKESIRLHLAASLVIDCATLDAMRYTRQPIGQLSIPPIAPAHKSFCAVMHQMANAGAYMINSHSSAAEAMRQHVVTEPRSRKKTEARTNRSSKHEVDHLSYCTSWLGGRSGPSALSSRASVQITSGLMSASYRSIYIPLWIHGNHHGYRVARLDSAQHIAINNLSPAHKMCNMLSSEDFQIAERAATKSHDASLLTVAQACKLLGIETSVEEVPGVPCSTSSRAVQDAEVAVMKLKAHDAALLIAFSRIAILRSTLLSYDLGENTKRAQAKAVCKRLLLDLAPGEDPCVAAQTRLPEHATILHCCSECRRVVNSVQESCGKDQPFNELGLSASMLTTGDCTSAAHMRCARRSSAALRTAVALEAVAEKTSIEQRDVCTDALVPVDLKPATIVSTMCNVSKRKSGEGLSSSSLSSSQRESSSEVAKFRRDLKSCFEQKERATSCGDLPLVRVPILGRAIRVFGNWHAICAMCGTMSRILPNSRFRSDVCCLKCDFKMLAGQKEALEMQNALPRANAPSCRFCGKVEPKNGTGIKWKCLDAPADQGGKNALIPPPLRTCHYCPAHYRSWLVAAHKTMDTSTIFSHLVSRARPIFGANVDSGSKSAPCSELNDLNKVKDSKKQSASSKRKSALTRVIAKNNRKRRLKT
tara:strand:+ start:6112 stop:9072 length:2961 start_codon:yes stop_codon:yes gene_type:complete